MPSLKWRLTQELLSLCRYEIALHAACLVRNGAAMLVFGPPGAGKSTLCLNLLAAGMGFAADDLTLVHCGGLVQGVPFAPTVKRGTWALAQKLGYKLDDETFRAAGRKEREIHCSGADLDRPLADPMGGHPRPARKQSYGAEPYRRDQCA